MICSKFQIIWIPRFQIIQILNVLKYLQLKQRLPFWELNYGHWVYIVRYMVGNLVSRWIISGAIEHDFLWYVPTQIIILNSVISILMHFCACLPPVFSQIRALQAALSCMSSIEMWHNKWLQTFLTVYCGYTVVNVQCYPIRRNVIRGQKYCTCPAGWVTYNFHSPCNYMHLSFKSICNKERKGVICSMTSLSNSFQSTRPTGRVLWEKLLVLSIFHS